MSKKSTVRLQVTNPNDTQVFLCLKILDFVGVILVVSLGKGYAINLNCCKNLSKCVLYSIFDLLRRSKNNYLCLRAGEVGLFAL